MADMDPEILESTALDKVLSLLSLKSYFPGKISRVKMYEVTEDSFSDFETSKLEHVGWYFLRKIISYNYQARGFQIQSAPESTDIKQPKRPIIRRQNKPGTTLGGIHPLDVVVAVFLCLDPICQQDLIMHLWACRLAVPFVISVGNLPHLYLWPMRSIVMRWESLVDDEINTFETRLANYSMEGIGFIRLSQTEVSKSELLNDIIAESEKTHPMFFHRNLAGSLRDKMASNGMVEIAWYFPKGEKKDSFQNCQRFANLRGDSRDYPKLLEVLLMMSGKIVIMCKTTDLQDKDSTVLVKRLLSCQTYVVLVVTDDKITDESMVVLENFLEDLSITDEQMTVVTVEDKKKAGLITEIKDVLKSFKTDKRISLQDVAKEISEVGVVVDEDDDVFRASKQEAQNVLNLVCKEKAEERKTKLLPLQGDYWRLWSKADKAIHRLKEKSASEDINSYIERQEAVKRTARKNQFEIIENGLPAYISAFINSISCQEDRSVNFFLRCLKHMLDDTSRDELSPKYKEYGKLMSCLAGTCEKERKEINLKLEHLDGIMGEMSFGLEHLIRELAQIYEALASAQSDKMSVLSSEFNALPLVAARLLLNGYPLEIMDGDVSAVPLTWVEAVLKFLVKFLKDRENMDTIRILVLSVLGIQSSGKSTFLNTLFGLQFAVSAGRCTRGVYMQLVKIEDMLRDKIGLDYILAIDTEGLKSPELSSETGRAHDNELSTFVIGLGDVTLINLMGENTTYLAEFLPISVHAFLRMDSVGLHPKCAIVHQNVDRRNKEKLLQQGRVLENILNELTKVACNFENVDEKPFKDIISFNISSDILHMPALLEGAQPMAPISTEYSEEARRVKKYLLLQPEDPKSQNSLEVFSRHVRLLWNAIKKDDFVYEFKNTVETEARGKLDKEWCRWTWELRQAVKKFIIDTHTLIRNCLSIEELNETSANIETSIVQFITEEYKRHLTCLIEFLNNPEKLHKEAFQRWKDNTQRSFQHLKDDLERECKKKVDSFIDDKKRSLKIQEDRSKYENEISGFIKQFVEKEKVRSGQKKLNLTEQYLRHIFKEQWKTWLTEIIKKYPRKQQPDEIEKDVQDALVEHFRTHKKLVLDKITPNKPIAAYNLCDFKSQKSHCTMNVASRAWKYVTGRDRDTIEMSIQIASSIISEADKILAEVEMKQEPYYAGIISAILAAVMDKSKTEDVTPQFKVDLAVAICGHAIPRLRTVRERTEKQNDPETIMNEAKERYFRLCKRCFDETNALGSVAADIVEGIISTIGVQLNTEIGSEIVMNIKTRSKTHFMFLNSKESFLLHVLVELMESKDFELMYKYIHMPKQAMEEILRRDVKSYCNSPRGNGTALDDIVKSKVHEKFQVVKSVLDDTEEALGHKQVDFKTWEATFRKLARMRFILPDLSYVEIVEVETFVVSSLSVEIKNQLHEAEGKMQLLFSACLLHSEMYQDEAVNQIFKDIIGCTEYCPFCHEICKCGQESHGGKHECFQHRPIGCLGCHDKETKVIMSDTCNFCVSSELTFPHPDHFHDDTKRVPFKKYATIYPDWKIVGDVSLEAGKFWKCFFVTYLDSLVKKYEVEKCEVRQDWRFLCMDNEIETLKEGIAYGWKY